jgi:hypothetical protein
VAEGRFPKPSPPLSLAVAADWHPDYLMVLTNRTDLGPADVGSDYVLDPGSPAAL